MYRDPDAGLAARTAALEAAWQAAAARVPPEALHVLSKRRRRIANGRVSGLVYALVLPFLVHGLFFSGPPFRGGDLEDGMAALAVPFYALWFLLPVALVKTVIWVVMFQRRDRLPRRLLEVPADPPEAIQKLTNLTPRTAVVAEAARLEAASVRWHLVGSNWSLFMACMLLGSQMVPITRALPRSTLVMLGLMAVVHAVADTVTRRALRIGRRLPPWLIATLIVATLGVTSGFFAQEDSGLGVIILIVTLSLRAFLLQRAVLRERESLC